MAPSLRTWPSGSKRSSAGGGASHVDRVGSLVACADVAGEDESSCGGSARLGVAEADDAVNSAGVDEREGTHQKPGFTIARYGIEKDEASEFYGESGCQIEGAGENGIGAGVREHSDSDEVAVAVESHAEPGCGIGAGVVVCGDEVARGVVVGDLGDIVRAGLDDFAGRAVGRAALAPALIEVERLLGGSHARCCSAAVLSCGVFMADWKCVEAGACKCAMWWSGRSMLVVPACDWYADSPWC